MIFKKMPESDQMLSTQAKSAMSNFSQVIKNDVLMNFKLHYLAGIFIFYFIGRFRYLENKIYKHIISFLWSWLSVQYIFMIIWSLGIVLIAIVLTIVFNHAK